MACGRGHSDPGKSPDAGPMARRAHRMVAFWGRFRQSPMRGTMRQNRFIDESAAARPAVGCRLAAIEPPKSTHRTRIHPHAGTDGSPNVRVHKVRYTLAR